MRNITIRYNKIYGILPQQYHQYHLGGPSRRWGLSVFFVTRTMESATRQVEIVLQFFFSNISRYAHVLSKIINQFEK